MPQHSTLFPSIYNQPSPHTSRQGRKSLSLQHPPLCTHPNHLYKVTKLGTTTQPFMCRRRKLLLLPLFVSSSLVVELDLGSHRNQSVFFSILLEVEGIRSSKLLASRKTQALVGKGKSFRGSSVAEKLKVLKATMETQILDGF